MRDRITTIVVNSVVILALCLLIFIAGTAWRLHSQYRLGEQALNRGDFTGAVAGFESAIHMYIPFDPAIDSAAEKLWQIGETNERLGDISRALIAYRALRSSYYAAHWLTTPGTAWIAKCDKKIAALVPLLRER